ncbi:unnamed protein product, partial [Mesorhabditis spiculigera]
MLSNRLHLMFCATFMLGAFVLHANAMKCYSCVWATKPEYIADIAKTQPGEKMPAFTTSCEKPTSETPTCDGAPACISLSQAGNKTVRFCATAKQATDLGITADKTSTKPCGDALEMRMCFCNTDLCNKE